VEKQGAGAVKQRAEQNHHRIGQPERFRRVGQRGIGRHRQRAEGEEREILMQVAEAEKRHQQHWRDMLGEHAGKPSRPSLSSAILQFMAKHFGSVFILAMAQMAESRSPYAEDPDATEEMAADEAIHEEIIRALATSGREKLSGNFRAAVFGANDGLVSNLALTIGITASGASSSMVLLSGIAGLLSGALSMAAGEFVSVRSQRELLDASQPTQVTLRVASDLDIDANELELIYRARGMDEEAAHHRALERFGYLDCDCDPSLSHRADEEGEEENVALGTDIGAAAASFSFFASGALVPILPYIFGLSGLWAMALSLLFVALALGAVCALPAHAGPPRKDVSPPPSAPPAIMRKVRSAVIVSTTTRSNAPATQNSHSMRTS